MKRYLRNEMSREEWLAARLPNINSSEAAVVCGEAPWGSPAILYAEKKGLRPPAEDSAVFRRGRWGEASVFEAMAETFPDWQIRRAQIYVVDEHKRQGSTPDGFARAPDRPGIGVVQTKTVSRGVFRKKYLLEEDDNLVDGEAMLPAAYQIQTIQDMRINQCAWGCVPVLIVGEYDWNFRMFQIEPNEPLAARIDYLIERFFADYLDPGIMPPYEPARDSELIRQLYPKDDGTTIDLAGDNEVPLLVDELAEMKAAAKRVKARCEEIQTVLTGKLGPHTYGTLADGRRISWKIQHRKAHTVPASHPRVFRIGKGGPAEP